MDRRLLLLATALEAILVVLLWGPVQPLLLPLAMLVLVVIPGYLLSFGAVAPRHLDRFDRLVLSLGLGLTIAVLTGIVLNMTPLGITPAGWAAALALMIGIAIISGLGHLPRLASASAIRVPGMGQIETWRWLIALIAIGLCLVAFEVARFSATAARTPELTQLWALPSESQASILEVGVRNEESQTTSYRLVVSADNAQAREWELTLDDGEEFGISIPQPTGVDVSIQLFRADDTAPYREVHVTP